MPNQAEPGYTLPHPAEPAKLDINPPKSAARPAKPYRRDWLPKMPV